MTQAEYDSGRDKLLKAISQPESLSAGDKALRNRSISDLRMALDELDRQWAKQSNTSAGRTSYTQFSRG